MIGRALEQAAPGPPGGCVVEKLTGGARDPKLAGLTPGSLTGSGGNSRVVSAREVELGCMASEDTTGGGGPGRGHAPGNPKGLEIWAFCPLNRGGSKKAEKEQKQVICHQTSIWERLRAYQGRIRQQ